MREYATRLLAFVTVGILLAMNCVGEVVQSLHVYGHVAAQDLMQVSVALFWLTPWLLCSHTDAPYILKAIAAAAHINVLLGSACVAYLVSRTLYRIVYPSADRPAEATRMVCLASEVSIQRYVSDGAAAMQRAGNTDDATTPQEDVAALEFRDMCRLQSVRASVCIRADDKMPRIAYVTPMWLWYYLYTVGVGVFVMGYTLNGGHDVASGTMALSLTICAVGLSVCDAVQAGAMWGIARRYFYSHPHAHTARS
jgi:hypothetical protein